MGKPNNTLTLQGHLAYEPELKKTTTGSFYCRVYISIDESYTDLNTKERVERSSLIPVVVFGDEAKKVCSKGHKKDPVKVVAHLSNNKFFDKDLNRETHVLQAQVSNAKDSIKLLFSKR